MQLVTSENKIVDLKIEQTIEKTIFRSRRDELISRLTDGINKLRKGTKYGPINKRTVAIKANSNPFLKNDGELELLIKTCEQKNNYSKFFWITKIIKKLK